MIKWAILSWARFKNKSNTLSNLKGDILVKYRFFCNYIFCKHFYRGKSILFYSQGVNWHKNGYSYPNQTHTEMKKLFILTFAALSLSLGAMAQSTYKNSIGLGIDFGTGPTLVGPSFKHFFNGNSAIQAEALFGNHTTRIQAFYQYHQRISGAKGLNWYIGGGPGLDFNDENYYGYYKYNDKYYDKYYGHSYTQFLLMPQVGLDFKIPGAPIALDFDWRPTAFVGDNSHFEAGRFGFGFRFTF